MRPPPFRDPHSTNAIGRLPAFALTYGLLAAFALTYSTHIVWSLRLLTADAAAPIGKYVLAGIGAFLPPIGAVHGVMIWFGAGG